MLATDYNALQIVFQGTSYSDSQPDQLPGTQIQLKKLVGYISYFTVTCSEDIRLKMAHNSATSAANVKSTSTTMTLLSQEGRILGRVSFRRPYTAE